jgi:hypothetical protein
LPRAEKYRTEKLKAELYAVKIFDDVIKKDKFGNFRYNSIDNVKDAKWAIPQKSLKGKMYVVEEFIADKPPKYKPRFKTKKKKVRFLEPTPPREIEEPDPATEVDLTKVKNLTDVVN